MQRTRSNHRLVWLRDGSVCQYCGDYGNQVEHVIPWSSTQDNSLGNLVIACFRCNAKAGARAFLSFEAKREWILRARGMPERIPEVLPDHVCDGCSSRQWCLARSVCFSESYAARGLVARLMADFSPVLDSGRALDSSLRATQTEAIGPPLTFLGMIEMIPRDESGWDEWESAKRRAGVA